MHLTEDERGRLYLMERMLHSMTFDLPPASCVRVLVALREQLADAIRAHGHLVATEPEDGE